MFHPVESKPGFSQLEEEILRFWKKERIFEKSVEQRRNGPRYTLYEGPPTVNSKPGIHHVLSRVFKDVFPRYKSMQGYYTPRIAGWDTHGLPVELGIENELGFTSKTEIEAYGIGKFNARCRESVTANIGEWNRLTERIGFWVDLDHPYITYNNTFIESCWWLIKQLWDRGLVYQGHRVTPHCPRCVTSLSSHEVALGYKDDTPDPSVFVKFRVPKRVVPSFLERYGANADLDIFLLAWTTTPWTLPGNTALAIAEDADYAIVEIEIDNRKEQMILAKELLESALKHPYRILGTLEGKSLAGLQYEPLYRLGPEFYQRWEREYLEGHISVSGALVNDHPGNDEKYKVIAGDFVSMDDGTGIVHIAPAFGEADYEAGKREGLYFVRDYVNERGIMSGDPLFEGCFIKDADPRILENLRKRRLLYRKETIKHTYPFCWRCNAPLVYYAKNSWYVKTTAKKEALIRWNERINWYPEHIKRGRFGDWLENNIDWAFSRERYWGTPLPIWQCEGCGKFDCIGSFDELKAKPGVAGIGPEPDFHRPYMDEITFTCECGQTMRRVPEVIDCWFDSGAMPFAQRHYPFENETLLTDGRFPADYICEAVDQTRGWFYSLHALSVILFDQPAYKNVICLGHILDAEGEKMSKSKGNVVEPWQVINQYGADALRWYLLTSSPPGNVRRFSAEAVMEGLRRFLLTLWNTYSFFVTYANIDGFDPRGTKDLGARPELDRWILSELNQLIDEVTGALDNYDATGAGRKIERFVDDLSNWYIRRSRRRFWKSENDTDKLSAHAALYECLTILSRLLAPITPFIADEIYRNLVCSADPESPQSVHLSDFPAADRSRIDEKLSTETQLVMKVTSLGRSARSKASLKVRQPLATAIIRVKAKSESDALKRLEHQIIEELNIKEVIVTTDESKLVEFEIKPNLALLGPKYGKELGKIKSALAEINPREIASNVKEGKEISAAGFILLPDEVIVSTIPKAGYSVVEEGGYIVGISTDVSPELAEEGMAREIVHRLQTMRRSAEFDIADYITTYYQGEESVRQVISKFADYIKQETLSKELIEGESPDGAYTEAHKLEGKTITFGVKR